MLDNTIATNNPQHILQVSELTKKVRFILESELNTLWLTGEISNLVCASSGHWYLSLKDSKAQVRCAMFKGNNRYSRVKPINGMQVLVKAKVSLYEPRGDFQLIIEQMEDAGEGLLKQRYEQLKAQLNAEGIFDNRYKQPLPKHINTVGVITSPTGAAVKDILTVLKRRSPQTNVIIYPCLVQGELAKNEISTAIDLANERDECDILIVGRGGGSLEDLWAFNEEEVVRSVFSSEIPIVSAVGHEIDHSLADLVADIRAATPSAAAELVSTDSDQLGQQLVKTNRQLLNHLHRSFKQFTNQWQQLSYRLSLHEPQQQLMQQQQRHDLLHSQLIKLITAKLSKASEQTSHINHRLNLQNLTRTIAEHHSRVTILNQRLNQVNANNLSYQKGKLEKLAYELNLVSPLATISRGYTITKNEQNGIVNSVEDTHDGANLTTLVKDGTITSKVVAVNKK